MQSQKQYNTTPKARADGDIIYHDEIDSIGNTKVTQGTVLSAGIDSITVVDAGYTQTRCTGDTLVQTGAGRLHRVRITQPAATLPTAGVLTIYDNTAESGTILFQHYIPNAAITTALEWEIDTPVGTGIYVGFDATLANVVVSVSHLLNSSL